MQQRLAFWILTLMAVVYIVLLFITPIAASGLTIKYQLSTAQAHLLGLSVALPLIAIWYIALYGYTLFRRYARSIANSPEGKYFSQLSDGLLALAFSLPIRAVLGQVGNWLMYSHPTWTKTIVIVQNYLILILMLVALILIFRGARGLYGLVKKRSVVYEVVLAAVFTVAAAAFCNLTLTDPARQMPADGAARATYYLSNFWLVVTIIIPYIVGWLAGLLAVYYIRQYRKNISGTVYRQALSSTALGITISVLSFMFIQYLTSFNSALNRATLQAILLIVYLLLIVFGVGFVLIATGAKKLRWLEEV